MNMGRDENGSGEVMDGENMTMFDGEYAINSVGDRLGSQRRHGQYPTILRTTWNVRRGNEDENVNVGRQSSGTYEASGREDIRASDIEDGSGRESLMGMIGCTSIITQDKRCTPGNST